MESMGGMRISASLLTGNLDPRPYPYLPNIYNLREIQCLAHVGCHTRLEGQKVLKLSPDVAL